MTLQENETHVLLAEDDDDDYLIFSMAIAETKVAVALTRAKDGENLMKVLSEHIPDILFLDMHMPCKHGRECLKEIRSNQRYDDLPIIIFSSFTDPGTIEYCFREGSNLYTIKPNSISELTEILRRILMVDWKKTMYYPRQSEFVINPLT
jgi:CheY-like chemotaxis protein